ncbi:MAG TPA: CHAD domain-containing protein [Alcanivorax sp.]|nr:CHAD domain-containing protein [Alcanivorax sp.]
MSKAVTPASDLSGRLAGAACHQDETVLSLLDGQSNLTPDQVHQVRVAVKRLRAIWRVMAGVVDKKTARRQDKALRMAARALAGARDLQVMGETLDSLRKGARDYEADAIDAVRALALEARQDAVSPATPEGLEGVFRADLYLWRNLNIEANDADLIKKGFGRLYAESRQQGLEAVVENEPALWHGFRKRVKYQLYQLEPLESSLEDSDISLKEFRKLGKLLGELHDLHVLDEHLRRRKKECEDKEPFVIVRQLIARLEADRVAECRKRTRRCYSLKPKAFRKNLAGASQRGTA